MVGTADIDQSMGTSDTYQGCTQAKNVSVTFLTGEKPPEIQLNDCGGENPEIIDPHGIPIRYVAVDATDSSVKGRISIRYSDEDLDGLDEGKLVIECYGDGVWEVLDSNVDADNNTVTAIALSMSTFALVYNGTSVNTKKSIYQPGDVAEIIIVVLDHAGAPVRNAAIKMTIDAPDGIYYHSTANRTVVPTDRDGVYEASHNTTVEGRYNITCIAVIDCNLSYFDTYFMVQSEYDFDIIRNAESVIDPTRFNRFYVDIDIISHTNASGITIWEYVPANFIIFTDANVIDAGNIKVLTWQRNLIDNMTSVSYSYSVPMEWPMLYQLGPVEVDYGGETFREAGVWWVAVDPEMITNGEFTSDLSGWTVDKNTLSSLVWYDSGSPQSGCVRGHTYGSHKAGTGNIYQTFSSDANPSSAILAYKWRKWAVSKTPDKQDITIQLIRPDDTVAWSWTDSTKVGKDTTTAWYSEDKDVTSYIDVAGTWKVKLIWDLDNPSGGSAKTGADFDDISLEITEAGDNAAPSISNVVNSTPTGSQVYITWDTNQSDSDNRVKYSMNSNLSGCTWSGWANDTDSVNILLTGLSPSTTYYYSAYSYNGTDSSLYSSSSIRSFTTAGSESGVTTYDFSSDAGINKWAYKKQASSKPPSSNDVPGTQFTSDEYDNITTNNGIFQSDTADENCYAAHRFKFNIQEEIDKLSKIYVFWNGMGYHDYNTDGATLYIWNHNDDVYEQLDNTANSGEVDLTGEIASNFGDYIDADGYLTIMVEQNDKTWKKGCCGMMGGGGGHEWYYSYIKTDYVKVNIHYTAANHPPSVETPKTYDPSLIEKYTFEIGEKVTIRANVTDPEGADDIDAVTITITNSTVMVDNATMTNISAITKGYIYEYNYTVPEEPASRGHWFVDVYASDNSSAKSTASTFFKVISLNVTVDAGGPYDPGDVVSINGRVLYANGTPVDQAAVELNSTDPDDEVVNCTTVYTDSTGDFTLSYTLSNNATAGMYTVEANVTKGNLQQIETTTYSVKKVIKPSNIRIVTDRDVYLITPQIWADKGYPYYSPRTVNISVLVMDNDGMCVPGKAPTVTVGYPNGSNQSIAMIEYQDGFWNGDFTVYHDDPTNTYTINATVIGEESYSGNSTFDVDRFRCDSDNCHNYEWHKKGPRDAHDASAQEAHWAHSPIRSRGKSQCRVCHTGQNLDCTECHTDLFRGTHANVSGSTLTEQCNHCHVGYNDYADTGIAEPVPGCNTSDCHNGQHEDKPAMLHQETHADNKVDCGFCHNNMHSIFEPSCGLCHQTKDDHSEEYAVNCSICHDNKPMVYTGVKLYNSTEEKYNTTYYTNVDIHSNNLIPDCTACHGSPQYKDHLGEANCTQCHDNVPLDYTGGDVLPENIYYTNATIHTTNRTLILPNQTLTYNDNCAICHSQIYDRTPEQHSNSTNCSACHWGPNMGYQGVVQDKPIEHTTNMTRVGCFECHTNWTMIEKTGKTRYWVDATMYNASVHGTSPGTDCADCHTKYHPPPEYTWKWCDCCHVVQSDPVNDTDRHEVTASPFTLDVTDCTDCHNETSYNESVSRYGGASSEHNCRWCHTNPDQEYE